MAKGKKGSIDVTPPATPATTATTTILTAPNSYAEAEAFALVWLKAVQDANTTGWQAEFRVAWDDAGGFVSATITKKFVGFDLERGLAEAIEALQYDRPISSTLKGTLLHVLWEKQLELASKAGRPTGSPWAGTIWMIAHLFKCSGFPLSRNPLSPEISGFDAIANAMRAMSLAPNSYSGAKANFYDYAKRNGLS